MDWWPFSKNKKNYSPDYSRYLEYFHSKRPKRTPIEQVRFVVLDTETTGLDVKKSKLLSIAALEVKNFEIDISKRLEYFIQQANYQPNESVTIHGILSQQSQEGISEKSAIGTLLDFLQDSIIVGHHIGFDKAMLDMAAQHHHGGKLRNKTLDTARLARRIHNPFDAPMSKQQQLSLDALCRQYHIPLGERHTAAADTYITALLFLKLLARLKKRGVKTIGELMKR